ncbi:SDR family NAD(P)-dependent oxidoreductase [Actinomadura kijaniata]|uniref:SDR family NAD(P)-dependent oxidoreductase n=1 Tax=Actinomadura kijaniata TaxID=46161 RepID=UPI00082DDE84|nr:SDR family NAD(P)-dependent oxidoreductase [Actinomadura kijaniata]
MEERVYLITGGGSGIGAAVAHGARAAGARAVICGRRRDALERVAAASGADARVADVTSPEAVAALVAEVVDAHGRLDGVVANAGTMRPGAVLDLTAQDWQASLDTNLTSVFHLARATLPHLVAARGAFVAVSSIAALRASTGAAAYAVSKAGLTTLTRSIAVDYGGQGVRANVVCPGWIRTEMADAEMRAFGDPLDLDVDEAYAEVTQLVPQGRPGTPEEAAAAVLWLLGPHASYVNGAVLTVDGGTVLPDPGTIPFDYEVRPRS